MFNGAQKKELFYFNTTFDFQRDYWSVLLLWTLKSYFNETIREVSRGSVLLVEMLTIRGHLKRTTSTFLCVCVVCHLMISYCCKILI